MDQYFDVILGPDGTISIPAHFLAARGWTEGSTITLMDTAHGIIVNEQEQLERLVDSRLAGVDPIGAFVEELKRRRDLPDEG